MVIIYANIDDDIQTGGAIVASGIIVNDRFSSGI